MKKIIILSVLVFIFAPQAFAEDVTTGNASAYTSVQNTNNNGKIESHVITIVNGVKTETDSNTSGNIQVHVTNTADSREDASTPAVSPTITATPISTLKYEKEKKKQQFLEGFFMSLRNFFSSLFK